MASQKGGASKLVIILVVVALVLVGWWWWTQRDQEAAVDEPVIELNGEEFTEFETDFGEDTDAGTDEEAAPLP